MKYELNISGIKSEKELSSVIRYIRNKNEVIEVNGDLKGSCGEMKLKNGMTISYNKIRSV